MRGNTSNNSIDFKCNENVVGHDFYTITSQTRVSDKDSVLICICERCKKTFDIHIECPGHTCLPPRQPQHHLVPIDVTESHEDKYNPVIDRAEYICSAVDCSLRIGVQVGAPRLPQRFEGPLLDRSAVLRRLDDLYANEPTRYEELRIPERRIKLLPAHYLLLYLNDVIGADPTKEEPPKVSVRNKFFTVCFWDRFQELFDHLEFKIVGDDDEKFLQLPLLKDGYSKSTKIGALPPRRAWFEVLRAHIYLLLDNLPPDQKTPIPPVDYHIEQSIESTLTKVLEAFYNKSTASSLDDYSPHDFALLGAEKTMHEKLVLYAAICQKQTNPGQRRAIFDALSRVSRGRELTCAELKTYIENEGYELAVQESTQDVQPALTQLGSAYKFFGLQEDCIDEAVTEAFSARYTQERQTEDDHRQARLNASIIGKARQSSRIMQSACLFLGKDDAEEFLNLKGVSDPEAARAQLISYVYEAPSWFDHALVAAAARALAKVYDDNRDLHSFAQEQESEACKIEPWMAGADITLPGAVSAADERVDPQLPVGLVNIRNTCYLNSILQYFHTVVAVRDIIFNWGKYKLDVTNESIRSRRLGGSGSTLDRAEAFLASKFVEEMRMLFTELESSNAKFVRPEQRLAIAALKTADQLVKGTPAVEPAPLIGPLPNPNAIKDPSLPPSLPPRPSPNLLNADSSHPTGLTVKVEAVDGTDTNSNVSSVTLVDQKDDDDDQTYVQVSDPPVPPAIPAKQRSVLEEDDNRERGRSATRDMEKDVTMGGTNEATHGHTEDDPFTIEDKITKALNDKTVTGTEQQDVEEVMGNVLEHLHAAIRPTGTDPSTGKQTDIITDTFYWSSIKYIRPVDMKTGRPTAEYRSVNDLSRWMTAFPPAEGKIDLYSALDRSFDQEYQEDGNETFTSITNASPIVHVYIQRSQNVNGRLGRNNNIVEIPEVLYLDRYMDGKSDSDIFQRRQRSWNLKRRLKALDGRHLQTEAPKEQPTKNEDTKEAGYEVLSKDIEPYEEALLSLGTGEGEGEEEYVSILDTDTQKMLADQNFLPPAQATNGVEVDMVSSPRESYLAQLDPQAAKSANLATQEEKTQIQEELSSLFTDMKSVAYRLHAVICHGGSLGGGHYWVWIYDFEKDTWRNYNDERVEEYSDRTKVLADLNASGNPYYLAYVRESEVDQLVTVPLRTPRPQNDDNSHVGGEHANPPAPIENPPQPPSPPVLVEPTEVIDGIDVDMEDAHVQHVENRSN